jgi:hypothetical protein
MSDRKVQKPFSFFNFEIIDCETFHDAAGVCRHA